MDTHTLFVTYVAAGLLYCFLPLRHNIALRMLYFAIVVINMLFTVVRIIDYDNTCNNEQYDDISNIYISVVCAIEIVMFIAFFTLPVDRYSSVVRMLHLAVLFILSASVANIVCDRIVTMSVMEARELLSIADIHNDTIMRCVNW